MALLRFIFLLVPVLCQAGENLAEFDKSRFKYSTFFCSAHVDCNFGLCDPDGMCQCNHGYRDSTEAACDHEMATPDNIKAWGLEAGLGWIVPAGWFYLGLWPSALVRLAVQFTAGGFWFGYFWERDEYFKNIRQENFKALVYLGSAAVFSAAHLGAWVFSSYFLSWFDMM